MKKMFAVFIFSIYTLAMVAGCSGDSAREEVKWDMRPIVMIGSTIYIDTGNEISADIDDADIAGTIASSVDGTERPTENAQSNFGCEGSEYAYYENSIIVKIDGKWILFEQENAE